MSQQVKKTPETTIRLNLALSAAVIVSALLQVFVLRGIALWNYFDYGDHARFAQEAYETGNLAPSHVGYLLQALAAKSLMPDFEWVWALVMVSAVALTITSAQVFFTLLSSAGKNNASNGVLVSVVLLTISLMIIAPASIITLPLVRNFFWAVPHPNPYHSPTTVALKPWAIAATSLAFMVIDAARYRSSSRLKRYGIIAGSALLIAGMTLTKPSYTIVLLPAIAIVGAYYYRRHRDKLWWQLFVFGFALPSVVILAWQYFGVYVEDNLYGPMNTGSVGVDFLGAWDEISLRIQHPVMPRRLHLLLNMATVFLFPVTAYLTCRREAVKSVRLNTVWVITIVATLIAAIFVESGPRLDHGNFIWGMRISLFILYVYSVGFLVEQWQSGVLSRTSYRVYAVGAVYALHVISGILWYAAHLDIPTALLWY